jgi:pyruvate kinase
MDTITTIGPKSWAEEIVEAHITLGVKCIRFPFAKEPPAEQVARCMKVKRIAAGLGKVVLTMADLPGGKPRLSNIAPLPISADRSYRIALSPTKSSSADIFVDPPVPTGVLKDGDFATIGDGENRFFVESSQDSIVLGRFESSGELERRRAFLPNGANLNIEPFTETDREMARVAYLGEFDWLALSFINSAEDVTKAREWLMKELNWNPRIVAKIETLGGTLRISEIAAVADCVMLARGDLALQVGFSRLWRAQELILDACKSMNIYSIAATGFLDNASNHLIPTRSECIDICTALKMGADAIMLSAETTIGTHPVEVVQLLRDISAGCKASIF